MPFEKLHWDNPRKAIANVYEHNDMAYSLHGTLCAADTLKIIDKPVSELANKSILDYGCGTGKNLRAIHFFFKKCTGYDPVENCIKYCQLEEDYINQPNPNFPKKIPLVNSSKMFYTHNFNELNGVIFDYIQCNNVLEHLTFEECEEAWENMLNVTSSGSIIIFSASQGKNKKFLQTYINKEPIYGNYYKIIIE